MTVHRRGSVITIPKKLSHHIPVMPIWESTNFSETITTKYHDIDSEDFQIYKQARRGGKERP